MATRIVFFVESILKLGHSFQGLDQQHRQRRQQEQQRRQQKTSSFHFEDHFEIATEAGFAEKTLLRTIYVKNVGGGNEGKKGSGFIAATATKVLQQQLDTFGLIIKAVAKIFRSTTILKQETVTHFFH